MWVRGLKLEYKCKMNGVKIMSHPVWVRGLKLYMMIFLRLKPIVAPRVGAWIETVPVADGPVRGASHPVWVRGLKLSLSNDRDPR